MAVWGFSILAVIKGEVPRESRAKTENLPFRTPMGGEMPLGLVWELAFLIEKIADNIRINRVRMTRRPTRALIWSSQLQLKLIP